MTMEEVADRRAGPLPVREAAAAALARIDLSIVIVTWNSERWIERCLQAIEAACDGLQHETIVYDNASFDRTLSRVGPQVQVVPGGENAGFAAGINRAIARSRGRYVFLLNPDCELAPRALAQLVGFLDEHPEAAAAAPLLSDDDGQSQREFQLRRLPTPATFIGEVLALPRLLPRNRQTARYRYRDLDLSAPCLVEQPAAAALLLRRSVYDEIGPLDEQFVPAWFEDVDYCRRLSEAGKSVFVVPAATARHFGGASLEHVAFVNFIDVWYRNMWLYARKWFTVPQTEALRWVIIAGMLLRLPLALLGIAHGEAGRAKAMRAYAGVLRNSFFRWKAR